MQFVRAYNGERLTVILCVRVFGCKKKKTVYYYTTLYYYTSLLRLLNSKCVLHCIQGSPFVSGQLESKRGMNCRLGA